MIAEVQSVIDQMRWDYVGYTIMAMMLVASLFERK